MQCALTASRGLDTLKAHQRPAPNKDPLVPGNRRITSIRTSGAAAAEAHRHHRAQQHPRMPVTTRSRSSRSRHHATPPAVAAAAPSGPGAPGGAPGTQGPAGAAAAGSAPPAVPHASLPRLGLETVASNLAQSNGLGPYPPVSQRHAAVLVPLFEDEDGVVRVILTQRSHKLSSHKGEVCLPGGKRDPSDPSDAFTALREASEELELPPESVDVVCQLPPVLSKHFLSVTPVVGKVPSTFTPKPNPAEVAHAFNVPLAMFLNPAGGAHSWEDIAWEGHPYRIHFFEHDRWTIWGLTASILIQVAKQGFASEPLYQENTRDGEQYGRFFHDGQKLSVRGCPVAAPTALGCGCGSSS